MSLEEITKFLQTYSGRDKVIRILCYGTKLASGLAKTQSTAEKLNIFSSQMSNCRVILRLFDDLPMLSHTLQYGLGKEERDKLIRICNVLSNIVDQAFFPIEHIEWLASRKVIDIPSSPWSLASTWCWVVSLYLSLMRAIRSITILQQHKKCLKKVDFNVSTPYPQLISQQKRDLIVALRCCIDLVHAIHYLPEGFLWSGKLNTWQVGAVGTISSLIGLYQAVSKLRS